MLLEHDDATFQT